LTYIRQVLSGTEAPVRYRSDGLVTAIKQEDVY